MVQKQSGAGYSCEQKTLIALTWAGSSFIFVFSRGKGTYALEAYEPPGVQSGQSLGLDAAMVFVSANGLDLRPVACGLQFWFLSFNLGSLQRTFDG